MATYNVVTNYSTTLATSITSSQDTIPVSSVYTFDGHLLTFADFGNEVYLTIEPGTVNEEIIKATGLDTPNSTWTGAVRGLAFYGISETTVTNNQKAHSAGSIVIMSNVHYHEKRFVDKESDETVNGVKTFTAPNFPKIDNSAILPTLQGQFATKQYVDNAAIAGGVNATLAQQGFVQLSTDGQLQTGTDIGATGASVAAHGNNFNSSPTANKVPVSDSNALISQGWVDQLFTAGEAIDTTAAGANKPLAVYIKESDGKVYKTNTTTITDQAAWNFIGFAVFNQNVALNGSVKVRLYGIVPNFSGLTIGNYYYLTTTAGAVTNSSGTLQVGKAISATQLYIEVGKKHFKFLQAFSSTTTAAITVGFRPSVISIYAGNAATAFSIGGWNDVSSGGGVQNSCLANLKSASFAVFNNFAWYTGDGAGAYHRGIVTTLTNTGFTLDNTKQGAAPDVTMTVEVFGN